MQLEQLSYIESELEALEREQESIDLKASALEKKLRGVMGGTGDNSKKILYLRTEQLFIKTLFRFRFRGDRGTTTGSMVYAGEQEECAATKTDAAEHFVSTFNLNLKQHFSYLMLFVSVRVCREQENDLERKYALLNRELRAALSVEDWRKSEAQRDRERLLLDELVAIVNKRNELVQHLHSQEQA